MAFYYGYHSGDSCIEGDSERYGSGESEDEEEEEEERYHWPFYHVGAPTHVLEPRGELLKKMSNLLVNVADPTEDLNSFGEAAGMLPGLPGLNVNDVGCVSLPLREENAAQLKAVGAVVKDNLWLLKPAQVEMKNPEWGQGIHSLSVLCAEKLGFTGVALVPVLTMLLLYGKGGGLSRQQANDSTGRCVVTILVQLPSVYTGGDVIVNDHSGAEGFQYDLGKEDGTAEFKPQFVVYPTGAYVAVEEVTSGYVLVAAYSLCLPPGLPSFSGRSASCLQQVQLCEVIKKIAASEDSMKGCTALSSEDRLSSSKAETVAFVLFQSYDEKEIELNGVESLTGLDRCRVQLLVAANGLLPPRKQLKFYVACLYYQGEDYWRGVEAGERTSWFGVHGDKIGDTSFNWSTKLNFLNPDDETLGELWSSDDSDPSRGYKRFAVVGWPVCSDIKNRFSWIGEVPAANAVLAGQPVDLSDLQAFLQCESEHHTEKTRNPRSSYGSGYPYAVGYGYASTSRNPELSARPPLTLQLCRGLCRAVAESNDASLVATFFGTCFPRLKEKGELVSNIATLVRAFGWESVGVCIEKAVDQLSCAEGMGFALTLLELLKDNISTQAALTIFVIKKAKLWSTTSASEFASSQDIATMWKHAAACGRPQALHDIGNIFQQMNGQLLRPVVSMLSKLVSGASPQEQRFILRIIIGRRREWLAAEIVDIQKPFTCQVVDNNFPNAAELIQFLKGPNASCEIRGFKSIVETRSRVALLQAKLKACLSMTSEGRGVHAFVRITKTSGMFDPRRGKLPEYKAEHCQLNQLMTLVVPANKSATVRNAKTDITTGRATPLVKIPSADSSEVANSACGGNKSTIAPRSRVDDSVCVDSSRSNVQNPGLEDAIATASNDQTSSSSAPHHSSCSGSSERGHHARESGSVARMTSDSGSTRLKSPGTNASPVGINAHTSNENSHDESSSSSTCENVVAGRSDHLPVSTHTNLPESEGHPVSNFSGTAQANARSTARSSTSDVAQVRQNDHALPVVGSPATGTKHEETGGEAAQQGFSSLRGGNAVRSGRLSNFEKSPGIGGDDIRNLVVVLRPATSAELPVEHPDANDENRHANASTLARFEGLTTIGKKRLREDDPTAAAG